MSTVSGASNRNHDCSTQLDTGPDVGQTSQANAVTSQGNTVQQAQSAATGSPPPPSSSARGMCPPAVSGYAASQQQIQAALAGDVRYQELSNAVTTGEEYLKRFANVNAHTVFNGDNAMTLGEIVAVANDKNNPANADAKWLLEHAEVWSSASGLDGRNPGLLTGTEVQQYINNKKAARNARHDEVSAEVKGNPPAKGTKETEGGKGKDEVAGGEVSTEGEAAQTDEAKAPKKTADEVAESVPKAPPSSKSGLDGALDNLVSGADRAERQIEAVINDPNLSDLEKQQKLSKLQQQQQMYMNMLNQLQSMISNTAKLWSDIAMNAVRNIR